MFPPGREALLQDSTVAEALRHVSAVGWTDEARMSAKAALLAMSDRQPQAYHEQQHQGQKHIMLSYQWTYQAVVKRIVRELQARGYQTWFGA
eukprot:COSAG02_NODE_11308_length_1750_cov_1.366445_1_plen_92_part_00